MIPEVKAGQRISAAAANAVIRRVNGLQTPSDSFVNTPDGTLTPARGYDPRYGYFPVPSTVLQAKRGPAVKMTRRGTKTDYDRYDVTEEVMTWHVFLGPDVDTLLKVLPSKNPPSAVWLGGATPDLTIEITDVFLRSLRRAECYADLAAYGETALAVKEVRLTDSNRQSDPGVTVLVICGTSFDGFQKILDAYGTYDTATEVNSVLFAKIDGDQDPFQLPLKAPASQISSAEYTGDSQVPVLHLSSVAVRNAAGEDYIQLHEFQADNTRQVSSLNPARVDVLVRNRAAAGGRELQYVALSSISGGGEGRYVPPDADVPEAGMSSIQTYESGGGPVEELFNFHDLSTVSVDCESLSGYDLVMRDPGTMTVKYGRLSVDILPDSSAAEQSSVAWLSGKTLQLWNFDDLTCGTSSVCRLSCNSGPEHLLSGAEFLYREDGELRYGRLDVEVSCGKLSVDSDVSTQKSIDDKGGVLQLRGMDRAGVQMSAELTEDLDDVLSGGYEFVVRTGQGGEIKYARLKLKAQELSVDTGSSDEYGQKSIDWTDGGELQLYGMDGAGETRDVTLTSADASLLSDGYEFVVRKGGPGGIIGYTTLSAQVSGLHSVDAEVVRTQKSIELKKSGAVEYAQLYGMDDAGEGIENVDMAPAATSYKHILPDDEEFVIRNQRGGEIRYKNVAMCLSAFVGGEIRPVPPDGDTPGAQTSSIQTRNAGGTDVLELWNFHGSSANPLDEYGISGVDILYRESSELKYGRLSLSGILDDIDGLSDAVDGVSGAVDGISSAVDGLSSDVGEISSNVTNISTTVNSLTSRVRVVEIALGDTVSKVTALSGRQATISTDLSAAKEDISAISAQLSTLSTTLDTDVSNTQKSLEYATIDGVKAAQLYGMDAAGAGDEYVDMKDAATSYRQILPDDEEFVIRTGAGGEIRYKNVKMCLSAFAGGELTPIPMDGDTAGAQTSSLQTRTAGGATVAELWRFHDPSKIDLDENSISGYDLVMRDGSRVSYGRLSLSALTSEISALSDVITDVSDDIDEISSDLAEVSGQLSGLSVISSLSSKIDVISGNVDEISSKTDEISSKTDEISSKTDDISSDLEGLKDEVDGLSGLSGLSSLCGLTSLSDDFDDLKEGLSGLSGLSADSQLFNVQKSVDISADNSRHKYIQLHGMCEAGEPTEQVDMRYAKTGYQDILPDDEEFVIRTAQGGEIVYKNVGLTLSAYTGGGGSGDTIIVDSDYDEGQGYSLHESLDEETLPNGDKLLRIHNFDSDYSTEKNFYDYGDDYVYYFPEGTRRTQYTSDKWATPFRVYDPNTGRYELRWYQVTFRSNWQSQVNGLRQQITALTASGGTLDQITSDVSALSSQISGTWRTGGDETTNNADKACLSTGLSVANVQVKYNTVQVGDSSTQRTTITDGIVESGGSVIATGPYAQVWINGTITPTLKIGSTTLNEQQLQRLLQLI